MQLASFFPAVKDFFWTGLEPSTQNSQGSVSESLINIVTPSPVETQSLTIVTGEDWEVQADSSYVALIQNRVLTADSSQILSAEWLSN